MIRKLEDAFIWLAGAVFEIAAVATIVAYIVGLALYIGGYFK